MLFRSDGERCVFMVAGDPVLILGKFKHKDTKRIGVPVVTIEGFSLLTVGMRVARRLCKYDKKFGDTVFELIRHGGEGDTGTVYELNAIDDGNTFTRLSAMVKVGIDPDELKASIEEATKLANQ